jgi:uncharacterized repeat protein (TIGR01451 family)
VPKPELHLRRNSRQFLAICEDLFRRGHQVRFRALGQSMEPNIRSGEALTLEPATASSIRAGEIALTQSGGKFRLHRVVECDRSAGRIVTRGDAGLENDDAAERVIGRAVACDSRRGQTSLTKATTRLVHSLRRNRQRLRRAAALRLRRFRAAIIAACVAGAATLFVAVLPAFGQTADLTMTQTPSAPVVAAGSNYSYTEYATNNGPSAVPTGTLVIYQHTPPNTTFQSVTLIGTTNWTCVTPGVNGTGSIVCTYGAALASGSNTSADSITINMQVDAGTAADTTIEESATVTSQTTDPVPTNNTSITSILVEPAADADMAASISASQAPVFIYSSLTYTIVVQNLGQANAANVSVSDPLPAGTTLVSTSPPANWTCSGSSTVTCSLNSSLTMAQGTSATITITVTTPVTAATLSNTATVSSTTTDPVATNNTATAITVVQPLVCATPGHDGAGGTLTGTVNTYYQGSGTSNAGATSITVVTPSSGAANQINAGDLILIIQMQDAQISSSNSGAYGDGSPGDPATGSSALQSTGEFEFVTATTGVVAVTPATTPPTATIGIQGTGTGGGLLNSYVSAAASSSSTTQGQATFQAIRVPQYTSATLSSTLAPLSWNGSIGGVLALDVASQLSLGGTVSLDGMGFRGGGGIDLIGSTTGSNTDYVSLSPATLPALPPPAHSGANGSKGEGIVGTPHFVVPATITNTTTAVATGQTYAEGLPGGSFARGAPGNAGGGGTDGVTSSNADNDGGGAGGNGGSGGIGGYGWNDFIFGGGFGGAAFPASTGAVVMGGGGGAGTTNDGSYYNPGSGTGNADCGTGCTGIYSSGASGGGIVIIHAGSVTGTGTITANGLSATAPENDGGGGAGAGGSIILLANSGGLGGLTVNAKGGTGGNTWQTKAPGAFPGQRHGPGGGGGGGVIFLSASPLSNSVAGGLDGYTDTVQDSFGSTNGSNGLLSTSVSITQTPGTQSGAYCAGADLAVTNSGSPSPVVPGQDITYVQTVTNNGPQDALNAVFTEAFPANTSFVSLTETNNLGNPSTAWTCTTTGSISCTDPDVPSGAANTITFTIVVQVNAATASGTQIVDTDSVTSGTNDPVLTNNSATVVTIVGAANTANLLVTNTPSANAVSSPSTLTYTVSVANNGPSAASSVTLSMPIPASPLDLTFNMITPAPGWSCSTPSAGSTGNITCTIASLAANTSGTFAIKVNVVSGLSAGTQISETATVSSGTTDPNPTNNSATATVVVAGAGQSDLAVTNSVSPNPVLPGNNLTFTQVITNNDPNTSNATYTDAIPANTTFVSLAVPGGWNCGATIPPVGGTGTISCTDTTLATSPPSFTFTLVVKVGATTTPGTVITDTATVSSAGGDPNSANNTANASSVVASPSQADVAIVKTAAPEPVDQGTNLTYTLQVTNNGPAVAQGVQVTDPLPAQVTFASVSTTQGTCSQASGTVTCNLGSLSVGGLVIITINVNAATFSSNTLATNTATVITTVTTDPNLSNNTSSVVSTIQSPTAVQIASFRALAQPGGGVLVEWRTQEESRNLGFHVYREDAQGRHRVDPSLIAGSALLLSGGAPQHRAKSYRWFDPQGTARASYWLEDLDLNGTRTMHGPVSPEAAAQPVPPGENAMLLSQVNRVAAAPPSRISRGGFVPLPPALAAAPVALGSAMLDGMPAVKISVTAEGWYQVTRSQLVSAGFAPGSDARTLQLFAEGIEQPLLILGHQSGPLGANDAIEFYGTPIDTPFSGTRVYWLVNGTEPGLRIPVVATETSGREGQLAFPFTTVLEQRTTYFAALLNGENNDNFFGAIITSAPTDQDFTVLHSAPQTGLPITLDVTLQGVTDLQAHAVNVEFNGSSVGELDFENQANFTQTFSIDASLLHDGLNTVTLTALDGENDVSLVQSIALHYPHTYTADSDWLRAQAFAGSTITISGFTNPQIKVFDITEPQNISQLIGQIQSSNSSYGITLSVPRGYPEDRVLLAFSTDQLSAPAALAPHAPSSIAMQRDGGDIVVITNPDFASAAAPLVSWHESEGHEVALVTTDQIYDAYNYGEHSPFAIRDYLHHAARSWQAKPQAVLLVGGASFDPRNYLGFGNLDFVPSRMIETAAFKTASDDWLTDFRQNGFATIPTGRIPARSASDAALAISRIVNYEQGASAGSWQQQALVIADQNVGVDFTSEANFAAIDMPKSLTTTQILADGQDPSAVSQQIFAAINQGALIVNYTGHGSEEQWSFEDLFDDTSAANLTNSDRLPVFLLMDCLNGFFHDVYANSLSNALMFAPNGGAVAVWASSGFTNAPPQTQMDQALLSLLSANPAMPLGRAILQAKSGITDPDVRRTWILFGDPAMKLPLPNSTAAPSR